VLTSHTQLRSKSEIDDELVNAQTKGQPSSKRNYNKTKYAADRFNFIHIIDEAGVLTHPQKRS